MQQTQAILSKVLQREGFIDADSDWVTQYGGRSNTVWKIGTGADALICKLYAREDGNPLFLNLPGAEYDTLNALRAAQIAPSPLALLNTDAGDVLLYRHIEGQIWTSGPQHVAVLLNKLHGLTPNLSLRQLPSGSDALLNQAHTILKSVPRVFSLPEWLNSLVPVAPINSASIIHTDVVPGNLISTSSGLKLIDWQSPAIGDPCEDIASFLSPAMQILYRGCALSYDEEMAFFTHYNDREIIARYLALAPFFHARIAAYCCWKMNKGEMDYAAGFEAETNALDRCKYRHKN